LSVSFLGTGWPRESLEGGLSKTRVGMGEKITDEGDESFDDFHYK